jgi:hypothetical protein
VKPWLGHKGVFLGCACRFLFAWAAGKNSPTTLRQTPVGQIAFVWDALNQLPNMFCPESEVSLRRFRSGRMDEPRIEADCLVHVFYIGIDVVSVDSAFL